MDAIKLRWKKNANGTESAFLDISLPGMKRKKEYLKIVRGGDLSRKESKENEKLALAICEKRVNDYRMAKLGVMVPKSHRMFLDFYDECASSREIKGSTKLVWKATKRHLVEFLDFMGYKKDQLTINDIDQDFCEKFLIYLQDEAKPNSYKSGKFSVDAYKGVTKERLTVGTISVLYSKFKACLHRAARLKLISVDPTRLMERIKRGKAQREYLSVEEVQQLMATPYTNDCACRAFLFSCLTGLRISDIRNLDWIQVERFNGRWRALITQQKTSRPTYLEISDMAFGYMGERKVAGKVFDNLPGPTYINYPIYRWMRKAEIKKHISFHCARHTSAVMLISAGADIYTVSKILGHADIKTTQIYSDVIDRKKSDATDRVAALISGDTGGQNGDKKSEKEV